MKIAVGTAADVAGIPREALSRWLKRGEAGEQPYADFLALVLRVQALAQMSSLARIIKEAGGEPGIIQTESVKTSIWRGPKGEPRQIIEDHEIVEKQRWRRSSWRAAAWLLERRWPEEWGRPSRRCRQASTATNDPPELNPELEALFRKIYGDKDDPEPTPNN